jgi:murein L,D-transpeptidase YafK
MKKLVFFFVFIFFLLNVFAQNAYTPPGKSAKLITDIMPKIEDSLKKQFESSQLNWPPATVYIRSFKYERQLEVWIKNDSKAAFKLFKSYKVCMQSGTTGPKRMEGDYQVPEGFYHINDFNTNSMYHLSLGLNYPNSSDRILSDSLRPGSAIYIHGNCVSVGCIAIGDPSIEEVFAIATAAKNNGQDFVPVHVFPVKYGNQASMDYLTNAIKDNEYLKDFNKSIRGAYDFFESKKELPVIMVNQKGQYLFN